MRLSLKAMAVSGAVLWGGAILLVGLINLAYPNYGLSFLQMTNSVYPWFHTSHTLGAAIGRVLEGAIDGAIAAFVFAWMYNHFAERRSISSMSQY
jgi:hypothetical protein